MNFAMYYNLSNMAISVLLQNIYGRVLREGYYNNKFEVEARAAEEL